MTQTVELLEGTWEEISAHAEELKDKRLQVLVFPATVGSSNGALPKHQLEKQETLAEAFARVGTVSFDPGAAHAKKVWQEYVEEKHRRRNP